MCKNLSDSETFDVSNNSYPRGSTKTEDLDDSHVEPEPFKCHDRKKRGLELARGNNKTAGLYK